MIKYVKENKKEKEVFKSVRIEPRNAIKYIAQSGTSGYAIAAKSYITDYVNKHIPINWTKLFFDDSKNDFSDCIDMLAESAYYTNYSNYETVIIHSTPDIWQQHIEENKNIPNKIGYCTWETSKLPKKWVESINLLPEVWVPSNFNKESFIDSGVISTIKVVPHIWHNRRLIDKSIIKLFDNYKNIIPSNKFTFYCIAELNFRKGIEDLICVFDKFNNKYDDSQLILKVHYKGYSENSKKYCIDILSKLTDKLGKSIYLILDNLSNNEILTLHSFGDCYVSLNKGEGFGLTIFDAYNLGKKVISTGYGGQIDYLGKNYEGLVNFKINKVLGMEQFNSNYGSEQDWANPDLDHAYSLMEKFYEA